MYKIDIPGLLDQVARKEFISSPDMSGSYRCKTRWLSILRAISSIGLQNLFLDFLMDFMIITLFLPISHTYDGAYFSVT